MIECPGLQFYRWNDMQEEALRGTITRRLIAAERMMIAQIVLKKGDDVPRHSHHNEQITYVLTGKLLMLLGVHGEREIIVAAGEVLVIPPNVPHAAVALEDTLDVDVFSPPRADWLNKSDAYLRNDT